MNVVQVKLHGEDFPSVKTGYTILSDFNERRRRHCKKSRIQDLRDTTIIRGITSKFGLLWCQ